MERKILERGNEMSNKTTLFDRLRRLLSNLFFNLFLCVNKLSEEKYWEMTYEGWKQVYPEEWDKNEVTK
jgi:hypothetical protein